MADLDKYGSKYKHVKFERRDGILQMTLHTDGDSLRWDFAAHAELPEALRDVGADRENKVVIFTGSGEEFSGPRVEGSHPLFPEVPTLEFQDRLAWEARETLKNLLDIDVPMISAINGPAWRHSEIPLLGDIVLASDTACFQDSAHFPGGLVPGDGMHVVYPMLLGANRGRYFLLMGQVIDAAQALDLGLVSEVMPRDKLLPRAWEIAEYIAAKPMALVRNTRILLTEHIKREMRELLHLGLYTELYVQREAAGQKSAKAK